MPITRRFLGWDRPVLELVAEDLLAAASPPILDLSHLLVVVPTRNSGRRLREMLAHLADTQGRAISPPHVVPPEFLLSLISEPATGHLASPPETLLAWLSVLREVDLGEFPTLFPIPPAAQDFNWALATSKGLTELRNALGEAGLSMADVSTLLAGSLEEEDRWLELAGMEHLYEQAVEAHGILDLLAVRKSRTATPSLPSGITEIRLAGCPDPLPLAVEILDALSRSVPVEVLVHAPFAMAADFDAWGRPVPEVWQRRRILFPGNDFPVHVLPQPEAQAALAARAVLNCPGPGATLTIGVLDEEVTAPLERFLDEGGQATFNPSGSSLRSRGVIHLLRVLRELLAEESYHDFIELLRCPDFTAYLANSLLLWDSHRVFERFDELYRRHLFQDLRTLRSFLARGRSLGSSSVDLIGALEEVENLLARLRRAPVTESIPSVLQEILSSRPPARDDLVDRAYRAVSDTVQPVLDALAGTLGAQLDLSGPEIFDLIIHALEQETLYEDRPADSVELLGWLELHWDDAPHLIVTGFNEGFAPESVTGDIFLPESLRRRLAEHAPFATNETRLARDIYLMDALLQSRRAQGRVDFCMGKHSLAGDPLRPSRLLFLCPDEELPSRVQALFHDSPPPEEDLPWTPGFQLRPLPGDPPPYEPETLGVTAFKTYLTSPFDFYLRQVEKMNSVDADLREMDPLSFGNFCHDVLRIFGQEVAIRHEKDASAIREFLLETAERVALQWFGPSPTLPVRIQLQSARQRLSSAAEIQAQTRREGWLIESTELELSGAALLIAGVRINGRVDRIDRHEETGAIRVLDYKTGDQPHFPGAAHHVKVTSRTRLDWLPDYARFKIGPAEYRWKDLQLPLYRLGLDKRPEDQIECGYFNLPKATTETGIRLWAGLGEAHDEAALRCAEGVIQDVRSGRFWPAPASTEEDDFARLHLGMPEKTIESKPLLPATTLEKSE